VPPSAMCAHKLHGHSAQDGIERAPVIVWITNTGVHQVPRVHHMFLHLHGESPLLNVGEESCMGETIRR
jgi:hypothetical protein